MFGTIRKHSQGMWWFIIAAIIVTFVYWGASGRRGNRRGSGNYDFGSVLGRAVSEKDYMSARAEARIAFFFNSGEWPETAGRQFGYDETRETYQRIFLARKMEELGIHVPTDLAARIANDRVLRLMRGQPVPMDEFIKRVLTPADITASDFHRYISHELGIQQLLSVAGVSGSLFPPQEVESLFIREFSEYATEAVFFSLSNHIRSVAVTPEKLGNFFTNYLADYRVPERVQVVYVKFPTADYTNTISAHMLSLTNLEEIIEANYRQLGTNYFSDAKSPAEAKGKVRDMLLMNGAAGLALSNATVFATGLYNIASNAPTAENLTTYAAEHKLTARLSEPFSPETPASDFNVNAGVIQAAFKLTPEEPMAEPIVGNDAAYVFAFVRKVPSELPSFESVRERVTADFTMFEAAMAARDEGMTFHAAVTNGVAAGKSFADVAKETRHTLVTPPAFSRSTRSVDEIEKHVELNRYKLATINTKVGNASIFVPTRDGGFVVHVKSLTPPDAARIKTELPGFTRTVNSMLQNEAFQAWFSREAGKALQDTPLMRQAQQQQVSNAKP